jgi:hypothetical protein
MRECPLRASAHATAMPLAPKQHDVTTVITRKFAPSNTGHGVGEPAHLMFWPSTFFF